MGGDLLGDALVGRAGVGEGAIESVDGVAAHELGEQAGAVSLQVGDAGLLALLDKSV